MKKLLLFFFLFIFVSVLRPQNTAFSLADYKAFLSANQNMQTSGLYSMYNAGEFKAKLGINYHQALYLDSIQVKIGLTDFERTLIADNGFMATERNRGYSFLQLYADMYLKDLPVMVSTDAILHAFHMSYDMILTDLETGSLIPKLKSLLSAMRDKLPVLAAKYQQNPALDRNLRDIDLYLTIPQKIFEANSSPYFPENSTAVEELMGLILKEQSASYTLFSENCRIIDFSQFKPRGHYDEPENTGLPAYFRAMMWLGRIELYMSKSRSAPVQCPSQSAEDIQRQSIDALLLTELYELSGKQQAYKDIEDALRFFVGEQDNASLANLAYLKEITGVQNATDLLEAARLKAFQDSLSRQAFAGQKILSQILYSDPFEPDSIVPASAFMLFGQRFVIDSYVTGGVVYDKIKYNGEKVCRLFPSTLDPMFALGNSAAAQLLKGELDQYHYSSNLAALRYLIDSYTEDYWTSSLYNGWLNMIRALNPPRDRDKLPVFMQTAAFWQQKLNTQLASWTQLRHDNLLYAKQSYTGGTTCSFPYVFVEPIPEFYYNLKTLASGAASTFRNVNMTDQYYSDLIVDYFEFVKGVMDTLQTISEKELENTPLSGPEISFLKGLIAPFNTPGCGAPPYEGWYAKLYYRDWGNEGALSNPAYVVADIHTTPTDCGGNEMGWVKHVGTGFVDLGVFIAGDAFGGTQQQIAYCAPLLSYHEYTTTNFLRLTDNEWKETYFLQSLRPDWVNAYLADKDGNSRGTGSMLFVTGVNEDNGNKNIPDELILAQNYPNPFNSSTIIKFSIPAKASGLHTSLIIFNIQGKVVKHLLSGDLPAGNYLTSWDGTNDSNAGVASGIYFYKIQSGEFSASGKMNMIK